MAVGSRILSQIEKEINAWKDERIHKMTTIFTQNGSFGIKIVVIMWICSAYQTIISFSAWDKSSDPTAKN